MINIKNQYKKNTQNENLILCSTLDIINYTELLIQFNFLSNTDIINKFLNFIARDLIKKTNNCNKISKAVFLDVRKILLYNNYN